MWQQLHLELNSFKILQERGFGPFFISLYICDYFIEMKKYLQFIDAADDAATFPADYLQSMVCDGNATLKLRFHPSTKGTAHLTDLVTLTITEDTEQAVMTALSKEISLGRDSVIVVCDDVNSTFFHEDILSCTITTDV